MDATTGPLGDLGGVVGVAWGDYDNDGDLDLYLARWEAANKLFRKNGGGVFVDATSPPLGDTGLGRSVAWGDCDNDGDLDLYLANWWFGYPWSRNKIFLNHGGSFYDDSDYSVLGHPGYGNGVAWGDYDNDGDLDLYLSNAGTANKLFRNEGGGVFVDAMSLPLDGTGTGRGVAWGDYDNDGDLDLYVAGQDKLLRNVNLTGNHWLHVNLVGTDSNRSGIGARVKVVAGGVTQIREISGGSRYLSQNGLTAYFGLGAATSVTLLEVRWPSGIVQVVNSPPVDDAVTVTESSATGVQDPAIPSEFALHSNVPNPFNPETVIRYDVPAGGGQVTLRVFDVSGRLVRTLVDGVESEGQKTARWDGRNETGGFVASGVYFCRMTAPGYVEGRKMVFLK